MMNHSQWISALVLEQVLLGKNLDKSFELIFRKYNSSESENLPQIKDMVYGAIRELGRSSFYIKKLVPKKIDNQCLEALLHIVLFQISHERSNNFTLVNQAVDAAKKIDHKKCAFINAVLRNFLRNKDALQDEARKHESAVFSYPNWWINKVKDQYPKKWKDILDIGNTRPPLALRVNVKNIGVEEYSEMLGRHGIEHSLIGVEGVILKTPIGVDKIPGFCSRLWSTISSTYN
jgi:16S rRNA (cytosine967-C5)-methyltransferase